MNQTLNAPVTDPSKLPKWNYDGSSTGQATGEDSEVILWYFFYFLVSIFSFQFVSHNFLLKLDVTLVGLLQLVRRQFSRTHSGEATTFLYVHFDKIKFIYKNVVIIFLFDGLLQMEI